MENDRTEGQGLGFATDPETGYSRPLIGGGSDAGIAGVGEGGSEGTVSGGEGEGVQSGEPTTTPEGDPSPEGVGGDESGQGFLEPYLNDVPEDQREVVEPILERYRQEQDANFNRRFEQLREEARVPTTIYQSLLQDPVQTLNWIADKMQEERGLDVRSQLLERWQDGQQSQPPGEEGQPQPTGEENGDKPLTQAEFDRLLKEREEQREQEQKQEQWKQQQVQQQQKTVNSWIDDAAKKFSLPLDDPEGGEDPLRAVVIMQANSLHEQGVARGQAAVEMAVESVAKRFGSANSNGSGNKGEQPVTANGGTPPPSPEIDVSDTKQRKARMLELFPDPNN